MHIFLTVIQHPANDTFCEGSNAVLICVIFDDSTNDAANTTSWFTNGDTPAAVSDAMISNSRVDNVVTSVLTIENVSLKLMIMVLNTYVAQQFVLRVMLEWYQ